MKVEDMRADVIHVLSRQCWAPSTQSSFVRAKPSSELKIFIDTFKLVPHRVVLILLLPDQFLGGQNIFDNG